jgi:hypothetical protein
MMMQYWFLLNGRYHECVDWLIIRLEDFWTEVTRTTEKQDAIYEAKESASARQLPWLGSFL